ncbi:MAG: hypothetical protein WBG92_18135 [Thiohalocapsa sp.]
MARLLSDQLSAATGLASVDPTLLSSVAARARLLAGVAVGGVAGVLITALLAAPAAIEPNLVRLLHGMVIIKALIFAGAAALVFRRLRGPVNARILVGYAAGLGVSAGALAWLWGLSGMLFGSIFFYGGLFIAFMMASRDPLLIEGLRAKVGNASRG